MPLISQSFAAGVPVRFAVPGNIARVKTVSGGVANSITIDLYKNGKKCAVDLSQVDAGDFATVPDGFDELWVTSTILQNVAVQYAVGNVGSNNGTFILSGTAGVAEQGSLYGASFASNAALGTGNEQIFAPGVNVNGVAIWACFISSYPSAAAASTFMGLIAKSGVAPTTAIDGDVLMALQNNTPTLVGAVANTIALPRPIKIAAGKGLWFRNSATVEGGGYRSIQYTVL